jgi:glycosyltransferase involved in cell wall biosynthesis
METHLQDLAGGLQEHVDVTVLVANEHSRTVEDSVAGVPVTRLGAPIQLAATSLCPGLVSRIQRSDADIVHIHLPNPTAVLAYLASRHVGRLVFTYHSDVIRQRVLNVLFQPFLDRALRRSSAVIASSPNYVVSSPVLKRFDDRCCVVPFGIQIDRFACFDADGVSRLRQLHGNRLVLATGRLVYYKGFEYLIRAMAQISGRLLLVGSGPLSGDLKSLAAALGISARVVFLQNVTDGELVNLYHAADVFVLPSLARSEAFGYVQVEAMAAGKPVINTQIASGVPFVSIHDVTGLTVPPADADALACAVNRLLDNEELRSAYGRAAHLRAVNEFSVTRMIARTLHLYEDIMSRPPGDPVGQF